MVTIAAGLALAFLVYLSAGWLAAQVDAHGVRTLLLGLLGLLLLPLLLLVQPVATPWAAVISSGFITYGVQTIKINRQIKRAARQSQEWRAYCESLKGDARTVRVPPSTISSATRPC